MNDLEWEWEWESSVPRAEGQAYHLYGGYQPPDPVPPPGPTGVYGKTRA